MRRVLGLAVVLVLLASGWWLYAATRLEQGIEGWLAARSAEGWQAEAADVRVRGYPFDLRATIDRWALADPETGVAAEGPALFIDAALWRPGELRVSLPDEDIRFATPRAHASLRAAEAVALMRVSDLSALEVREVAATSGRWSVSAPEGSLWAAEGMHLQLVQDAETPARYDVAFDAPAFQPGSVPRKAMRIPADWPVAFDSLTLEMSVLFDRPIDRAALEVARPQPRRIDLKLAEAVWGSLSLRASAALDVAEDGLPSGTLSLQAEDWQQMLTLAEASGTLPSQLRPQVETIMRALARGSGNPDTIDITLELKDGRIFLGFIPLGRAAPLILP